MLPQKRQLPNGVRLPSEFPMSANPEITIRRATPDDLDELARMTAELNRFVGYGDPVYGRDELERHGFSGDPSYEAIIADADGASVGYAIFCPVYNTDHGKPGLWLCDLYVDEAWRSHGLGKRLFQAVAAIGRAKGMISIWWTAETNNPHAMGFYRGLGGRDFKEISYFEMDGDAYEAAADAGKLASEP